MWRNRTSSGWHFAKTEKGVVRSACSHGYKMPPSAERVHDVVDLAHAQEHGRVCARCARLVSASVPAEKWCSGCHETKDITEFHRFKASPDGHQRWCKECSRVRQLGRRSTGVRQQPKAAGPRKDVAVSLDADVYALLVEAAEVAGITRSYFVALAIRERVSRSRLPLKSAG